MTRLLVPGLTCARTFPQPRSGLLVDGRDFYRALFDACCHAERSILMAGWEFSSGVPLLRGEDAESCGHPTKLVDFLRDLCKARPELEVHILAWNASPIFTLEREPMQQLRFQLRGNKRIHYKMDNAHPAGASHHQKFVVIDRSLAFLGGMDVCHGRWDDRDHPATFPERCAGRKHYPPFHDVQSYVTGDAVDVLRDWFADRWQLATKRPLVINGVIPRRDLEVEPTREVTAPIVGLARTLPRTEEPPRAAVSELYELHLRAISEAKQSIYIENQYLSCDELGRALMQRMTRDGDPLEIVILLPQKSAGFKERISIGIYQQRILEQLTRCAAQFGHHLGVYYSAARGDKGDVPVFVHAKVLAVDDRFLLVSSANQSNRSMGFDTELGIAWESPEPSESLRAARIDLLAEHTGLALTDARLRELPGLVARLDELAAAGEHRLRIHHRNADEKPGWLLAKLIPDETPFDPDDPMSFEEALPEPGAWLDKLFRDPLTLLFRRGHWFRTRLGQRRLKA